MAPHSHPVRRTAALVTAATAAVALAGCGSTDPSTSRSDQSGHGTRATTSAGSSRTDSPAHGSHNSQDVAFLQQMISHHRQAIAMADLAASRARSQRVKALASDIKQAQGPEITTMSGWLKSWGQKVPDADTPGKESAPGTGHSPAPGMMSRADMQKLMSLSGEAFDKAFLQMMIRHHQGAIEMTRTEQTRGVHERCRAMAMSIATSQSAQIVEMSSMQGK